MWRARSLMSMPSTLRSYEKKSDRSTSVFGIMDMIDKKLEDNMKDDDAKHKEYCIHEFDTDEASTVDQARGKERVSAHTEDGKKSRGELSATMTDTSLVSSRR